MNDDAEAYGTGAYGTGASGIGRGVVTVRHGGIRTIGLRPDARR